MRLFALSLFVASCSLAEALSILCADALAPCGVRFLEEAGCDVTSDLQGEPLSDALPRFDGVIVRSATTLDAALIELSALRVIGRAGVGVDNIDCAAALSNGVAVVSTPTASTNSVVELTVGHLLNAARSISKADAAVRNGEFADFKKQAGTSASELRGKNLGIVGFGRIGQGVARVATALGMRVHTTKEAEGVITLPIEALFAECTHVCVHCGLNDNTRGLVNARLLSLMPHTAPDGAECGAHLVNMARGGIVVESDVVAMLDSNRLTTYSTDVFETEPLPENDPLLSSKATLSPHVGAATIEAQERVSLDLARNVLAVLQNKRPTDESALVVAPDWLL